MLSWLLCFWVQESTARAPLALDSRAGTSRTALLTHLRSAVAGSERISRSTQLCFLITDGSNFWVHQWVLFWFYYANGHPLIAALSVSTEVIETAQSSLPAANVTTGRTYSLWPSSAKY
ncbi:hypothetical protein BS47DRAFT_1342850 [Hydnum rufescens UP504]|uniref:Secreted protein n=1 Tax=Hydnum rufescens UP504 TaxID=1448309 RepID=A0A9P6B1C0_9AGAM|nr:hypothetical protein BS47DRAFT_1342850 [Hydnum rufescens UP504]